MNKIEMTEVIMTAKSKSGLGWEAIAEKVGLDPVFVTSACLGMNSLKAEYADELCEVGEPPLRRIQARSPWSADVVLLWVGVARQHQQEPHEPPPRDPSRHCFEGEARVEPCEHLYCYVSAA